MDFNKEDFEAMKNFFGILIKTIVQNDKVHTACDSANEVLTLRKKVMPILEKNISDGKNNK